MSISLYLKAYATNGQQCPGVCLINIDSDVIERIHTLTTIVREFSMDRIGDHFNATWKDPVWEARFMLAAPQMFATHTQCWWTVEVITEHGTATLFTERVRIDQLVQACSECVNGTLYYTEDSSESVESRRHRFELEIDES